MNDRTTTRVIRATATVLVLAAAMLRVTPGLADHGANPADHAVPAIDLGLTSKAMSVSLDFTGAGTASMVDAQVVFGHARGRGGEPPLLRLSVFDDLGGLAQQFNGWDPRWIEFENLSGGLSNQVVASAVGHYVFPFAPELKTLTIFNSFEGVPVGSFDLGPAILAFCQAHPDDPDCRTDLQLFKGDSPDPVFAGALLTYTLTVHNAGPNPALQARLVDTLPAGFLYESDDSGCVEAPAGTLTCDLGDVPNGTDRTVTISGRPDPCLVFNAADAVTITNDASVSNVGPDLNPDDNTASADTRVEARDVNITKSRVSRTRLLARPDGRVRIRGDILAISALGDVFTVAGGITVRVLDSLGLDVTGSALPSECGVRNSGRMFCESADLKAHFRPLRIEPDVILFDVLLTRTPASSPFKGPVRIVLLYDGGVRLKDIAECRATGQGGLICRLL